MSKPVSFEGLVLLDDFDPATLGGESGRYCESMAHGEWAVAVGRARQLMKRCDEVRVALRREGAPTGAGIESSENRWALLVYAIAGSLNKDPWEIGFRHLRFRVEQAATPDELEGWVCARLQRLGHRVHRAAPLIVEGEEAPAEALRALLANDFTAGDGIGGAAGGDPVVRAWAGIEVLDARIKDNADRVSGTIQKRRYVNLRPLAAAIDAALIVECGGFAPGAVIRFPVSQRESGALPGGICRGIVERPLWSFDQEEQASRRARPSEYSVRSLHPLGGIPLADEAITVSAEGAAIDSEPW